MNHEINVGPYNVKCSLMVPSYEVAVLSHQVKQSTAD